jgi:hypothetical protein
MVGDGLREVAPGVGALRVRRVACLDGADRARPALACVFSFTQKAPNATDVRPEPAKASSKRTESRSNMRV